MSILLQTYLRFWAKIYLKRTKPKIVAITGSVGKTSTKEAIFEVLKIKFASQIRKSEGNLNNETGVPLAILGYKKSPANFWQWLPIILGSKFKSLFGKKYEILVLELAADKPGDIKYLTSFVRPDIACITSIGPAHMVAFGSLEKIVEEKVNLIKSLPADGWAVLNIDDENLKKVSFGGPSRFDSPLRPLRRIEASPIEASQVETGRWQTFTYAIFEKADVMAKNITTEINNFLPLTKFQVSNEEDKFRVAVSTLGRMGNVYSALAAVAVGFIFEMRPSEIIIGLKNVKSEKHRMNVLRGKNGCLIIDDSYNANPLSMKAALDVLKNLPEPPNQGKKIAVIGDMLEIGKISDEAHKLIGQYVKEIADIVVAVGDSAKKYQAKVYFEKPEPATEYLLKEIKQNDIILIKASRAIGLDKIVEALKE